MEPQQPQPSKLSHLSRSSHPQLQTIIPPPPHSSVTHRTANSTPVSSPGLFSPAISRANMSLPAQPLSEGTTPPAAQNSPFLHPLQSHKVRETHKANVDTDFTTGRKLINHYEIIDELGRGMHGKVKLARDLETGENVAIKIIPRFSKKRRLGKVTAMSTQDKSKKEIAILKKIRHPNVVALLEIIDDPELKKIYMVLEHVELGEVVWRKKGLPHICNFERRRVEREMSGEQPNAEEERYEQLMEERQALKNLKRAKLAQRQAGSDFWSLEHCPVDDDESIGVSRSVGRDLDALPLAGSASASKVTSRAPSRTHSAKSLAQSGTLHPSEPDLPPIPADGELENFGSLPSNSAMGALDGTMFGPYVEDSAFRVRSPSMADSIISHMSSLDYRVHDPFVDDFSYVPCFTIEAARSTFRDTVLGLEYLHYQGVVHRDIKPANLLCTKDHRVKISDFGVSYFGRPIRDGEPDETVSESEARDFDNDLELAKTVGTPAFFAPELCYTDDRAGLQPKVSEQIDVWSLGVTLYCLIFARIPFLAEDEWQMFKKIATENVYIPTKRLRPVDPSTKPDENSLYTRVNSAPYRDDDELAYEDIDWQLQDLLSKMLTKNPDQRIRLKEVKRHPWVSQGIPDRETWVRDTDLSARHTGKIQVDEKEMAHAVVPLNFVERTLERTKSTFSGVKKTIGKIMNARGERAESASRRRAASSAASSVADKLSLLGTSGTPQPREGRRKSLRGDVDYFATLTDAQPYTEYTSTYAATIATENPPHEEGSASASPPSALPVGGQPVRQVLELAADFNTRFSNAERQSQAPGHQKPATRHAHARSVTNAFLSLTPSLRESQTVPPSPSTHFDGPHDDPSSALRKARDMRPPIEDNSRARSVDRGLFASNDKRAEALVSLSTATAPGHVHIPFRPSPIRLSGFPKESEGILQPSPLSPSGPRALAGYQHGQPQSDPNMQSKRRSFVELEERPMTAHRVRDLPEAETPPPRVYNSTPESFARAQRQLVRRQALELEEERKRQQVLEAATLPDPAQVPCPPSPDDELFPRQSPAVFSRGDTVNTNLSSSSTSMGATVTPLTSPSLTTSPTCASNSLAAKDTTEQMLAFQSDPSLPALLSSTSSVSADPEGDFLGNPGVVDQPRSVIDTTDSLTPPALSKEPIAGFPLEAEEHILNGHSINSVMVPLAFGDRQPGLRTSSAPPVRSFDDDEDEDSDSDEGLTMGKSQRGRSQIKDRSSFGKFAARRRDTNASVGSTDTAKKLAVDHD